MKKILILDDHPVVLEGLAHIFKTQGYEVLKAVSITEASNIAKSGTQLNAMVVDLTVSDDADGISFIRNLRKNGITTPAVVYTMHEELWNIALLIESNVEGIVLKGERIDELIEAVGKVERGGTYRSPVFTQRLSSLKNSSETLSAKDVEILNLISNGVNTSEIADKMCLSPKAVEYHRNRIIKKLDSKNMTQAIRNAMKLGIISSIVMAMPFMSNAGEAPIQAVDLGLSVKWADRNLGASASEEAGGFYAFGETKQKETYSWDTYTHCDNGDMFSQHDLGTDDICNTAYDPAHVILGSDWRLPTLEEVTELIENCGIEVTAATDNTLCQVSFTADNGASISFPITGYMNNSTLRYVNKETELLTGTMEVEAEEEDGFSYRMNSPFALALTNTGNALTILVSPHLGFQVRPVFDGEPNAVDVMETDSEEECIYTIEGRRVDGDVRELPSGIYIRRSGNTSTKFISR